MYRLSTLFIFIVAFYLPFNANASNSTITSCSAEQPIVAVYQLTTQNKNTGKNTQQVELWRDANQVAIRYPASDVTEFWERTSNNKLHLIRYFDSHERGIEYQPDEIKGAHDWSLKRQLVSDLLINEMELRKTRGKMCNIVEYYVKKSGNAHLKLHWFADQKLIKRFQVKNEQNSIDWKLLNVISVPLKVAAEFDKLAYYDTTDYTDIGDNESDPFLLNMINLGFVEHAASGFYDAAGHVIGDGHKHHH